MKRQTPAEVLREFIASLERKIYLLRLEEADILKVHQGLNLGPIYPVPGLEKIREDIEENKAVIMQARSEILAFENRKPQPRRKRTRVVG
jgi:hypothetical protein